MKRLTLALFLLGASCASLVLPEKAWAVATVKTTLNSTTWTDLGVGPLLLNAGGNQVVYAISDLAPSIVQQGFALPTDKNETVNTASHVWAMAATPYAAFVYVSPVAATGGSGGTFTWPGTAGLGAVGTLATPGATAPYVNAYIVSGGSGGGGSSGFTPDNSYSTALGVSSVSAPGGTPLPSLAAAGSVIKIYNRGPAPFFWQVGNSSVVATTSNALLSPGCFDSVVVKAGQTNIAAITSLSVLTATMNVESGIGGPLGSGCTSNQSLFQVVGQGGIGWTKIGAQDNAGNSSGVEATAPGTIPTQWLLGWQGGGPAAVPAPIIPGAVPHANTTALAASLTVTATANKNLIGYNCVGITGGAPGYCIAYNSATVPGAGPLTGAQVLESCWFDGTPRGCSVEYTSSQVTFSSGIQLLVSVGSSPFTYTAGATAMLTANFQ